MRRDSCPCAGITHSSWGGFQTTREATIDEAIEQARSVGFDVVLLSLAGCEEGDSVTVKVIARICAGSPLLVLVGNCEEDFRTQLLRFGANSVMPKTDHPSELQNIIQNLYETNEPDLRLERVR